MDLPSSPNDYHPRRQVNRPKGRIKLLSYADMVTLPEPEWLIEGVIQKRSAGLLFGKSNTFKTFLAIDLGCSVAAAHDWHGNKVKQGKVLFVATEAANGVGRLRVPAWFDHYNIPIKKRAVSLYPQEIKLDTDGDISALIDALEQDSSYNLVVLDIFGGTMSGSESEDKTARAWVNGVQRIIRETWTPPLTWPNRRLYDSVL